MRRTGRLPWLLVGLFALLGALLPASAAAQRLLLDVIVNGVPLEKLGEFEERNGRLFVQPDELLQLGLRPPATALPSGGAIPLDSVPGLTDRIDRPAQAILMTATDECLMPRLVELGCGLPGAARPPGPTESGTGLALDYDLSASAIAGRPLVGGLLDLRGFSPWGVASTSLLGYVVNAGASPPRVRLDSTYVFADPEAMHRLSLGDFVTASPRWARSVRLGGIQFSADFALRPDLITFPLPVIGASAAVPSTLDVLVNGTRFASQQLAAGPFRIAQLPLLTGAGSASLTLTDSFGGRRQITLPSTPRSACWPRDCRTGPPKWERCAATGGWRATATAKRRRPAPGAAA